MEAEHDYFERKHAELALIARSLGRATTPRPRTIERVIETKFQLGAELRARHASQAWQNTEPSWKAGAPLRSGPFKFTYRYQRADLAVTGPFPYGSPERFAGAILEQPIYTCSGMAAISALLLAVAAGDSGTLVHLPGCYKETLEFGAAYAGLSTRCVVEVGLSPDRAILWLDSLPSRSNTSELYEYFKSADLLVFDTTAFSARSGRIRQFLSSAREARTPVVLVRSHTKLDTLGIEYGRLGSAVFLTFSDVPLTKFAKWREIARRMRDLVRLLGSAALPAHFCPFAGGRPYWELSSRRSAVMLRNGRLLVRTLMQKLGEATVRPYPHGMFAALLPPHAWEENEAAHEAQQVVTMLARSGLPVRHAGSFGFDFVAIEGFYDTGTDRHLLRVAIGDLPAANCVRLADGIAAWWERRWRMRAA